MATDNSTDLIELITEYADVEVCSRLEEGQMIGPNEEIIVL